MEVEDQGAELVRLYDKEKKAELLWNGDPAYWGRHAPVLFPNVGRHFRDHFQVQGEFFPSHQHGFARDSEFSCLEDGGTGRILHELKSDESSKKVYPFDFSLKVSHALEGSRLIITWEVFNPGSQTMFFAIGGHPAFRVPADSYREHKLYFEEKSSLIYYLIDPKGSGTVLAKEPHILALKEGCYALDRLCDGEKVLADALFDRDALVFDNGQIETVSLLAPDGKAILKLAGKGFANFGIWSAPGAPFVCLEPWAGRADDFGYEGEMKDKPGINALPAGECFSREYTIEVF